MVSALTSAHSFSQLGYGEVLCLSFLICKMGLRTMPQQALPSVSAGQERLPPASLAVAAGRGLALSLLFSWNPNIIPIHLHEHFLKKL